MSKNIVILIILIFGLLVSYQNCSGVNFSTVQKETPQCVQGKKLGIWLNDANQTYLGDIVSYSGSITAEANYNYHSSSAHPINGPNPIGYELHNFFYEGSDGLVLNFYGNIDSDDETNGSSDNQYSLKITVKGNGSADRVIFVDDPAHAEDVITVQNISGGKEYSASFHYWYNTDGAIIGDFQGENFEIYVDIVSAGDLQGARFYSADGTSFNLGQSSSMSYVIKYKEYEDCN